MSKKMLVIFASVILILVNISCESEENYGFPSRIGISGKGEFIEIEGSNDSPAIVKQIELLDYNGDGNSSGPLREDKDYLDVTTDWLTARYSFTEYKLILIAEPNETNKERKLNLFLLSGRTRQEISVTQSK